MKILTVVGARPQFIKAAVVSRVLRRKHQEILVHTGQHFDYNMSEQFFEELDIPKPDYNLNISGGTHAEMTGKMMIGIEHVLFQEKPDLVLIYGDTNSTLAAALAASKIHVPICHVEAGGRTHCMTNPEEINRICADHVSTILLVCTASGIESLANEGLKSRATLVGDPMLDAFVQYGKQAEKMTHSLASLVNHEAIGIPHEFYYMTCHREENTHDDGVLLEIFKAMEQLEAKVIYPVHPRNKERCVRLSKKYHLKNIIFTEPVGYLTSNYLVHHAKKIVTDSGGLQREAFFAGKQCVTILNFVCWPETMIQNRNQIALPEARDILQKLSEHQIVDPAYLPFGDGRAAEKIVDAINMYFQ